MYIYICRYYIHVILYIYIYINRYPRIVFRDSKALTLATDQLSCARARYARCAGGPSMPGIPISMAGMGGIYELL